MNMETGLGIGAFGDAAEGKVPDTGTATAVIEGQEVGVAVLAGIVSKGTDPDTGRIDNGALDAEAFRAKGGEITVGASAGHDRDDRYKPAEDAPALNGPF